MSNIFDIANNTSIKGIIISWGLKLLAMLGPVVIEPTHSHIK
jgi:hypothetical protein